ncbi:hypothetical protein [Nocardiopsis sp. CNS-639]|uniref:hypothetical protein n=1 Tax=Nocardiopsis sp. CNS-639 TaxID=1169153 RepID=UPI00037D668D|nr:hypothetical protein [Nocardiopsis sp. CNS-639]
MNPRPDAVMLSFDEPLANDLHTRLERVLERPVKRLHGVVGMRRAYRLAAELVDTDAFLLADGDFHIHTTFTLEPDALGEDVAMRVWKAANPVTGRAYGYGGMKLISRDALRHLGEAVDVLAALPGRVEFLEQVAGTTRFDQSPYHAWKAAFREVAMLTRGCEYGADTDTTREQLRAWSAPAGGRFTRWVQRGARDGTAFARSTPDDAPAWQRLNDPVWLRARFDAACAQERS